MIDCQPLFFDALKFLQRFIDWKQKTFESLVSSISFGSIAGKCSHVVVQGEEKDHYDS